MTKTRLIDYDESVKTVLVTPWEEYKLRGSKLMHGMALREYAPVVVVVVIAAVEKWFRINCVQYRFLKICKK